MPRGTYRLSRLSGHLDVFEITGDRHSAIVISQPESPEGKDDNPRLVFHRYGDSYFLREIRLPGNVAMACRRRGSSTMRRRGSSATPHRQSSSSIRGSDGSDRGQTRVRHGQTQV